MIAGCLLELAELALGAQALDEAAATLRESLELHGSVLDPPVRRWLDDTLTAIRSDLGDRFDEAWRSGADLEPEAAAELALGSLSGRP